MAHDERDQESEPTIVDRCGWLSGDPVRRDDIRQCTRDLLLVERAKERLLEDDGEYGDG